MENLQDYLKKAEELTSEDYNSPKVDLYLSRLKRYLEKNFTKEYAEMVDGYHFIGVITDCHPPHIINTQSILERANLLV